MPFVVVGGSEAIIFINPSIDYQETLILVKSQTAFGQQAYFFKQEDFGHSLIFSMQTGIDNGKERHNFVRMPLKQDFFKTLSKYARLPFTQAVQSVREFAELQVENIKLAAEAKERDKVLEELRART